MAQATVSAHSQGVRDCFFASETLSECLFLISGGVGIWESGGENMETILHQVGFLRLKIHPFLGLVLS